LTVDVRKIPDELLQSLKHVEGFNAKSFTEVHEQPKQVVSLRINPEKIQASPFADSEKVPWSSTGYYLPARPSFTLDPLLHAGAYYVHEASSMFLEHCLRQCADVTSSLKVLDLCAAPGGKSTLIQSFISKESLLVSNEVIRTRVPVLTENISKWGGANVIITNNDPRDFSRIENFFDVMVIDAPCSGSGLFRRDNDAIDEWSVDAVESCSLRQKRILTDAYPCLKQNGILIYSTCSYSPEEDEDIADWMMSNYRLTSLKIKTDPSWNIVETTSKIKHAHGYRFFPDKLRGEGFYIACFRKNDGDVTWNTSTKKSKIVKAGPSVHGIIEPWINKKSSVNVFYNGDEVYAFPASLEEDLLTLHSNLYIKKAGVPLGKLVRNELLPAHELAVSGLVNHELFTISLKKEEALQYLRKEEVTINGNHRGWALVQYAQQQLGWVKMLGNRINNYYPKEWRILKSGNV
jgi:16S rRNA C967 or C1407 C5-methylase (RsmB/RsmF family)/NOL1/NOP2/fmu family ribosome biogenesis protein